MNFYIIPSVCIILQAASGAASDILHAETNRNLLLYPNIRGNKEHILWKYKGNKMVEWDRTKPGIKEYLQFMQRTQLNTETGDVTVSRVTPADSGLYEADIIIDGKKKSFTQQVEVIDPVRNTSISCNKTGSTVTLLCEAEGPLLSYSWTGPGLQNPENRNPIQISGENLGSSYTCVVKNPVSEEKKSYPAGDCSTKERTALHAGSVVGCLLLLVSVLVGLLVYKRLKSRRDQANKESDEERSQYNQDMDHVQEGEEERLLKQPGKKKEVKQKHGGEGENETIQPDTKTNLQSQVRGGEDVDKSSSSINVDLSMIKQGNTENNIRKYEAMSPEKLIDKSDLKPHVQPPPARREEVRSADETSEPVRQELEDKNQQPNKDTDTSDENEGKKKTNKQDSAEDETRSSETLTKETPYSMAKTESAEQQEQKTPSDNQTEERNDQQSPNKQEHTPQPGMTKSPVKEAGGEEDQDVEAAPIKVADPDRQSPQPAAHGGESQSECEEENPKTSIKSAKICHFNSVCRDDKEAPQTKYPTKPLRSGLLRSPGKDQHEDAAAQPEPGASEDTRQSDKRAKKSKPPLPPKPQVKKEHHDVQVKEKEEATSEGQTESLQANTDNGDAAVDESKQSSTSR
ncbi:neurofilament heavy polypeptide-like isoform X1 [Denticeps clupeoides]|uniref:Ig-like domain-containing protein n=1 Tax=Denticeps clupeoides TaxID=299321 RepID=A0A8C4D1R5_9TELE|nr:neurofilament heavy polypeptide-like isoform X1 [Denticeps clupeoides]